MLQCLLQGRYYLRRTIKFIDLEAFSLRKLRSIQDAQTKSDCPSHILTEADFNQRQREDSLIY